MIKGLETAPAGMGRLFPHHRGTDLEDDEYLPFVIGRLLEEGDSDDLAWLSIRCGEHEIAAWMRRRGNRQLSARSRAFWTLLLDLETAIGEENPLWPV